jgi:hypothetical protein
MGRVLFGMLPFVFFRIWLRLVIAIGALVLGAIIMRSTGIGPYGVSLFSSGLGQVVYLILMAAMSVAIAVTVTAPFSVPNDLLIPWVIHRETGTPPERTPEQQTALERIRSGSKQMPKGGSWALGVRIVYTTKEQIVWTPTQVIYGALANLGFMLMVARILGGYEMSSWELLTEMYTRPIWLIGGAAGLVGGSIGRNYKEALIMGAGICGFALAAAVFMADLVHPWLMHVMPKVLYGLCLALILGRLFLPRLRRFGRLAHFALVGVVVPALVVGGIYYQAQRQAAKSQRQVSENEINVNWIWPTSGSRLLMTGYVEIYGYGLLFQRSKIGGVWAIEPEGHKLHYLTPGRAVRPTFDWPFLWGQKEHFRLDRIIIPMEPDEFGEMVRAGDSFASVHFTGRIEPVPGLDLDEELKKVAEQATRIGIKLDDKDVALIKKTLGDQPGPWESYPYPLRPAFYVEGGGELKDRRGFIIDLKDDRAYPLPKDTNYRGTLLDGHRGLKLLHIETVKGKTSMLVALDLKNLTRTLLTGPRDHLKLCGVTGRLVLIGFGDEHWYDKTYALASLDQTADMKVLVWPGEETRWATVTPGKLVHVWTDRQLHVIDPAGGEERAVARPEEVERFRIGVVGYLKGNPILKLKKELKILDTVTGKLKTLAKISSEPYL